MPRVPVALALPFPLPPAPTEPLPAPSPLQNAIQHTIQATDYDAVVIPLTNEHWQNRWERLCLRPMEDEDDEEEQKPEVIAAREREREVVDREADLWRKDGGLLREECNITRLVDGQRVVACAAEWLELDSPDEGIRFDAELVSGLLLDGAQLISRHYGQKWHTSSTSALAPSSFPRPSWQIGLTSHHMLE
jgi:protein arginine N-methyltransferase 5